MTLQSEYCALQKQAEGQHQHPPSEDMKRFTRTLTLDETRFDIYQVSVRQKLIFSLVEMGTKPLIHLEPKKI